jgi:restriction endonuclease S subunit
MKMRYDLSDAPEGTLVKIRVQSIGEVEIPLPPVVLAKKIQENLNADLKKLKKLLETGEV